MMIILFVGLRGLYKTNIVMYELKLILIPSPLVLGCLQEELYFR